MLAWAAIGVPDWRAPHDSPASVAAAETQVNTALGLAFTGIRVDGRGSGYLLPFVIVSVHLLVVLIGAAYMARTKRKASATRSAT